jgi:hypothetical protein
MFGSNPDDVKVLRNYAEAARWESQVKPIRGRAVECKPLGARNKSHANIRRESDDIVVRLYNTDIVRYKPDGSIIIRQGGYASQTTRKYLHAVLPMWFASHQGATTVAFVGVPGSQIMHSNGDNVFAYEPNSVRLVFTNPVPCIIHKVNRKAMNAVRAKYAVFINYMKNIRKLLGEERFTSEPPEKRYLSNDELLALATSSEPSDHYAAMVYLAWNGYYFSPRDPVVRFNTILMRHYRDEVLDTHTLPAGVLQHDKFKSLF